MPLSRQRRRVKSISPGQMAGKKKKFTAQMRKFADCYLLCMNATESAKQAGYSKKTSYSIGHQLLKKLEIQEYIEERRKEEEALVKISRLKSLKHLSMTVERALEPSIVRDMFGNPVMMKIEDDDEKTVIGVAVRHDPKTVIAATHELAKFMGWHEPEKIEDVTKNALSTLSKKLFGTIQK